MFMYGSNMNIKKRSEILNNKSKISINISPNVEKIYSIMMYNYTKYSNLIYIPQDSNSLNIMLWGKSNSTEQKEHFVNIDSEHPIFKNNRVRYFVDSSTWINYLKDFDFSFGTRIHGNIASLLAGTPSVVLTHDSRTRELVEYFKIPYKRIDEVSSELNISDLYNDADYTVLNKEHRKCYNTFINFLNKNGLKTIFSPNSQNMVENFDNKLGNIELPPLIQSFSYNNDSELIKWLKNKLYETNKKQLLINSKLSERMRLLSKILLFLIIIVIYLFIRLNTLDI